MYRLTIDGILAESNRLSQGDATVSPTSQGRVGNACKKPKPDVTLKSPKIQLCDIKEFHNSLELKTRLCLPARKGAWFVIDRSEGGIFAESPFQVLIAHCSASKKPVQVTSEIIKLPFNGKAIGIFDSAVLRHFKDQRNDVSNVDEMDSVLRRLSLECRHCVLESAIAPKELCLQVFRDKTRKVVVIGILSVNADCEVVH